MAALMPSTSLTRSLSTSLPCGGDVLGGLAVAAPRVARPLLLARSAAPRARPSLRVSAQLGDGMGQGLAAAAAAVRTGATKFCSRYDPVTTGLGSLLVTGYCVCVHEQPIGEALNIAAFATVLGMVLQEVLFHEELDRGQTKP